MRVDITFYLFIGLGLFLLLVALLTFLFPAKKPNHLYGYRTDRSMRNRANWKFAQRLLPPMFLRLALYQVGIAGLWYFVPRQSETVSMAVFLIFLIATFALEIFWSERKLRRYSRSQKK
tara:strand:+ start:8584 stop:8940 length:357 start_codon:yes stop_codon:yes gene_type:complete